jgi:hypothetical protein
VKPTSWNTAKNWAREKLQPGSSDTTYSGTSLENMLTCAFWAGAKAQQKYARTAAKTKKKKGKP